MQENDLNRIEINFWLLLCLIQQISNKISFSPLCCQQPNGFQILTLFQSTYLKNRVCNKIRKIKLDIQTENSLKKKCISGSSHSLQNDRLAQFEFGGIDPYGSGLILSKLGFGQPIILQRMQRVSFLLKILHFIRKKKL